MTKQQVIWLSCGSAVGAIALVLIALTLVSRKVFHRSLMASLVAVYFRLTVRHKSDEQVMADANYLPLVNDCPYRIPLRVRNRMQRAFNFCGMTVYGVNLNSTDTAVIYLHGGAYVRQPRLHHWKYINKLASRVGNVIVPIYPKAPNHHPDEVVGVLTKLYVELCNNFNNVVLMGDSSGGGLALILCQQWVRIGLKQPALTILYSPWTDLTLANPEVEQYQKVDPLISASGSRIWARLWAQDKDMRDPIVSPMFGDMSGLSKVLLFTGDNEILYPDLVKLYQIMQQQGVDVKFTVARGMNHVYQIYPIPEARAALREIVREISQLGVEKQ